MNSHILKKRANTSRGLVGDPALPAGSVNPPHIIPIATRSSLKQEDWLQIATCSRPHSQHVAWLKLQTQVIRIPKSAHFPNQTQCIKLGSILQTERAVRKSLLIQHSAHCAWLRPFEPRSKDSAISSEGSVITVAGMAPWLHQILSNTDTLARRSSPVPS